MFLKLHRYTLKETKGIYITVEPPGGLIVWSESKRRGGDRIIRKYRQIRIYSKLNTISEVKKLLRWFLQLKNKK